MFFLSRKKVRQYEWLRTGSRRGAAGGRCNDVAAVGRGRGLPKEIASSLALLAMTHEKK